MRTRPTILVFVICATGSVCFPPLVEASDQRTKLRALRDRGMDLLGKSLPQPGPELGAHRKEVHQVGVDIATRLKEGGIANRRLARRLAKLGRRLEVRVEVIDLLIQCARSPRNAIISACDLFLDAKKPSFISSQDMGTLRDAFLVPVTGELAMKATEAGSSHRSLHSTSTDYRTETGPKDLAALRRYIPLAKAVRVDPRVVKAANEVKATIIGTLAPVPSMPKPAPRADELKRLIAEIIASAANTPQAAIESARDLLVDPENGSLIQPDRIPDREALAAALFGPVIDALGENTTKAQSTLSWRLNSQDSDTVDYYSMTGPRDARNLRWLMALGHLVGAPRELMTAARAVRKGIRAVLPRSPKPQPQPTLGSWESHFEQAVSNRSD